MSAEAISDPGVKAVPQASSPPAETPLPDTSNSEDDSSTVTLTINYHQKPVPFTLPADATLTDLSTHITSTLSIPATSLKLLITPKPGLIRPPFRPEHASIFLSSLTNHKITLLGSTTASITALSTALDDLHTRQAARAASQAAARKIKPTKYIDSSRITDESKYTFHAITPLAHLPDPPASLAMLKRLAADAGIKAAMRSHKFSVGLLTEMDPAMHTRHDSKTLGLNRNGGEVIELRLRTDEGDGYRDYKTVRRTLCHELAHNVFSEHDRKFWDLMREIENEVLRTHGGKALGRDEYSAVVEEEEHADGGAWTGGSFTLGSGASGDGAGNGSDVLSAREMRAKAAEERARQASKE